MEKQNKKEKVEEFDMDIIPQIDLPKIDVTEYIGKKVKVVEAKVIGTQYGRAVKFETEIVADVGTKEKPALIVGTKLLGLQQDKDGVWGMGKDTKAQEFFTKYKITSHKDMIGKVVILQATEPKNGTQFLTFN